MLDTAVKILISKPLFAAKDNQAKWSVTADENFMPDLSLVNWSFLCEQCAKDNFKLKLRVSYITNFFSGYIK